MDARYRLALGHAPTTAHPSHGSAYHMPRSGSMKVAALLVMCLLLLGGFVYLKWMQIQKGKQAEEQGRDQVRLVESVQAAVQDAERSLRRAEQRLDDPLLSREAIQDARLALGSVADTRVDPRLPAELAQKMTDLLRESEQLQVISTISFQFDAIAAAVPNRKARLPGYATSFREQQLDLIRLPATRVPQLLAGWSDSRKLKLLPFIEEWLACATEPTEIKHLQEVLKTLDPNASELRQRWREVMGERLLLEMQSLSRVSQTPELPPLLVIALADQLHLAGGTDEAVQLLIEAQALHPSHFGINYELGRIALAMQPAQAEKAARYLSVAIALRPASAPSYELLGQALEGCRDKAAALRAYRQAVQIDPKRVLAQARLANFLREKDDIPAAIEALEAALAIQPQQVDALRMLGELRETKREPQKAIETYYTVLKIDPAQTATRSRLLRLLREQGKTEEIRKLLDAGISQNPKDVALLYERATLQRDAQAYDGAIKDAMSILAIDAKHIPSHLLLACIQLERKKTAEAEKHLREVIRLDQTNAAAQHQLGKILLDRGDRSGALACFQASVQLDSSRREALWDLGRTLYDAGRFSESISVLRNAQRSFPRTDLIQLEIDRRIKQAEKFQRTESLQRAIEKGERQATGKEWIDLAYFHRDARKDYAEAVRLFARAFSEDPNLPADLKAGYTFEACKAAVEASQQSGTTEQQESLRRQARNWMKADLLRCQARLSLAGPEDKQLIMEVMTRYLRAPELYAVRDSRALLKLPESEREQWISLRNQAEGMFKQVEQP